MALLPECESEHGSELGELEPAKGFCKYIGGVLVSWDVGDGDLLVRDLVANPVVGTVHMLHRQLMFRVLGDLDG